MEFLSLVNAVASQLNLQKIEAVCEMLEKLIVIGDQLEAAAAKEIKSVISSVADASNPVPPVS